MKTCALAFLLLVAAGADGAQTYRWVDEHGVTTYGEKPPPGQAARPVNIEPAGTVESGTPPAKGPAAPAAAVPAPSETAAAPASSPPAPRGMKFDTYIRLQVGMSEGDVLLRAGEPDRVSVDSGYLNSEKSLYYYPTSSDPFLTIVRLSSGRVVNIERNRKLY